MDWYNYIAWAAIGAQLLFLYHAVRNYRYVMANYESRERPSHRPRVALIVPCKGLDAHFHSNIRSFFAQDYDNYRLFFVVGEKSDPAYAELLNARAALRQSSRASDVQVFVAGPPSACSQKTHNLLYVFHRLGEETEILAFADSDVCVHDDWLGHLVQPLRRSKYGVSTGYRWFIPTKNNLASLALSAVNASIAQLLGNSIFNHAWGGSMAVRAEDFRRLNVPEIWKKTLSDDLSLSHTVKEAGMRVIFVPGCLVPSFESMTWGAFYEFARRQFLITRVYVPKTWWVGFASSLGSVLGLWATAGVAVFAGTRGTEHMLLYVSVPVIFFVGQLLRAVLRQSIAAKFLREYRARLKWTAVADVLGSWLRSLVLLFFILATACGRTISWRGIRYRLISPIQTQVLPDRQPVASGGVGSHVRHS